MNEARSQLRQYEATQEQFRLRIAGGLALDYSRSLLEAVGPIVGAPLGEGQTIKRKFELICDRVPRLYRWKDFIDEAYALRQLIAHTERRVPEPRNLRWHLLRAHGFSKGLSQVVKEWTPEASPSLEIDRQLQAIEKDLRRVIDTFGSFHEARERANLYRYRLKAFRTLLYSLSEHDESAIPTLLQLIEGEARAVGKLYENLCSERNDDIALSRWEDELAAQEGQEPIGARRSKRRGTRKGSRTRGPPPAS